MARLGGDEFVVLLENVEGSEVVTRLANRISKHLSEPLALRGVSVQLNAAIGIALGAAGTKEPKGLLREADVAMYRAKKGGMPYKMYDSASGEATDDAV